MWSTLSQLKTDRRSQYSKPSQNKQLFSAYTPEVFAPNAITQYATGEKHNKAVPNHRLVDNNGQKRSQEH